MFEIDLPPKAADETKEYAVDLAPYFPAADTASSLTFPDFPAGLTLVAPSLVGKEARFRVSGGAANASYVLTLRWSTSRSEVLEAVCRLLVTP